MEAAISQVEHGVKKLFKNPSRLPVSRNTAEEQHLCECKGSCAIPCEFDSLRRFPVLYRHVLDEWRRCFQLYKTNFDTDRSARCFSHLCYSMRSSGLLHSDANDVLERLVHLVPPFIILHIVTDTKAPLPLRPRLLLFIAALKTLSVSDLTHHSKKAEDWVVTNQELADWIQEATDSIQSILTESINVLKYSKQTMQEDGLRTPTKKRRRSKMEQDKQNLGHLQHTKCDFCMLQEDSSLTSFKSFWSEWDAIEQQLSNAVRTIQHRDKDGDLSNAYKSLSFLSETFRMLHTNDSSASIATSIHRSLSQIPTASSNGEWKDADERQVESRISREEYHRVAQEVIKANTGNPSTEVGVWNSVWHRAVQNNSTHDNIPLPTIICQCCEVDITCISMTSLDFTTSTYTTVVQQFGYQLLVRLVQKSAISFDKLLESFYMTWDTTRSEQRQHTGAISHQRTEFKQTSIGGMLQKYLYEIISRQSISDQALSVNIEWFRILFEIFGPDKSPETWMLIIQLVEKRSTDQPPSPTTYLSILASLQRQQASGNWTNTAAVLFIRTLKAFIQYQLSEIIVTNGSNCRQDREALSTPRSDDFVQFQGIITSIVKQLEIQDVGQLLASIIESDGLRTGKHQVSESSGLWYLGLLHYLFPAFNHYITPKVPSKKPNRKQMRSTFISILSSAYSELKEANAQLAFLPSFLRFCRAWDAYCVDTFVQDKTSTSEWGIDFLQQTFVYTDILSYFDTKGKLQQVDASSQVMLRSLLQKPNSMPTHLKEKSEYICNFLESLRRSGPDDMTYAAIKDDTSSMQEEFTDLSAALAHAGRANTLLQYTLHKYREGDESVLMQVKTNVERWVILIGQKSGEQLVGKETRSELVLLACQLLYHFPKVTGNIEALQTPVTHHVRKTVERFITGLSENGEILFPNDTTAVASTFSLELTLRAYLSAVMLPDLADFTRLIIQSTLQAKSATDVTQMMDLAIRFQQSILHEVVKKEIKQAMHLSGPDSVNMIGQTTRTKNALRMLKAPSFTTVFHLDWDVHLFGADEAVDWMELCFRLCLQGDKDDARRLLEQLVKCFESKAEKASLAKAYWLAALLSSATLLTYKSVLQDASSKLRDASAFVLQQLDLGGAEYEANGIVQQCCHVKLLESNSLNRGSCILKKVYVHTDGVTIFDVSGMQLEHHLVHQFGQRLFNRDQVDQSGVNDPFRLVFLPCHLYLKAALRHSQQFLYIPSSSEDSKAWEKAFHDAILQFYLPIEFQNDTFQLLLVWLQTWMDASLKRGEMTCRLVSLLAMQRRLFHRLCNRLRPKDCRDSFQLLESMLEWTLVDTEVDGQTSRKISVVQEAISELDLIDVITRSTQELTWEKVIISMERIQNDGKQMRLDDEITFHILEPLFQVLLLVSLNDGTDSTPMEADRLPSSLPGAANAFQNWSKRMLVMYGYLGYERCKCMLEDLSKTCSREDRTCSSRD